MQRLFCIPPGHPFLCRLSSTTTTPACAAWCRWLAGWVAVVVGALVALLLLREEQPQWNRLALNLCVAGVGATTLVALHLGRQALAAGLLVWGVWVVVSLVAASNGGINSPNLLIYPF